MKILIDMNLTPQWEETFAQHGIKATHWSKIGPASAPDREIMAWAVLPSAGRPFQEQNC